jgi:hypothetical protein
VALALRKTSPGIGLTVVEDVAPGCGARFERNELDMLVTRLDARALGSGLPHQRLFADQHRIVCGVHHPLLSHRRPTWRDLARCPWVMPPPGTPLRNAVEMTFATAGIALPEVLLSSASSTNNSVLLSRTDALGVMSSAAAAHLESHGVLRSLPLVLTHDMGDVGLVWREARLSRHRRAAAGVRAGGRRRRLDVDRPGPRALCRSSRGLGRRAERLGPLTSGWKVIHASHRTPRDSSRALAVIAMMGTLLKGEPASGWHGSPQAVQFGHLHPSGRSQPPRPPRSSARAPLPTVVADANRFSSPSIHLVHVVVSATRILGPSPSGATDDARRAVGRLPPGTAGAPSSQRTVAVKQLPWPGAARGDLATHALHHLARDRQAQPAAAVAPGRTGIGLREALEQVRQCVGGDADA